jgi:hypothetical protein
MIANVAFLAALVLFLLVAWIAGELRFLVPFKTLLFARYGSVIVGSALLVFLNLCSLFYGLARLLFLRDTGRKLTHLDRQLVTSDGVHQDLRQPLASPRRG